jgi:hypothetical protein
LAIDSSDLWLAYHAPCIGATRVAAEQILAAPSI